MSLHLLALPLLKICHVRSPASLWPPFSEQVQASWRGRGCTVQCGNASRMSGDFSTFQATRQIQPSEWLLLTRVGKRRHPAEPCLNSWPSESGANETARVLRHYVGVVWGAAVDHQNIFLWQEKSNSHLDSSLLPSADVCQVRTMCRASR